MQKHDGNIDYAKLTIADRNVIKRKLQKLRLQHSLKILKNIPRHFNGLILDFGAGNGELSRQISVRWPDAQIICYEPSAKLRQQAIDNTRQQPNIKVVAELNTFTPHSFDYVFCLEVFEHLPAEQIRAALAIQQQLLKRTGHLVLGIPNELFLAALLKGGFRMLRRFGEVDARLINILKAASGLPPKHREVILFDGLPYIIRHMGFDYRTFSLLVQQYFKIVHKYGSPFPLLPLFMNFEIYFIAQHKNR